MMCNCFVAINFPASTVVYVDDFLDDFLDSIAVWSLFRMYFVVRVAYIVFFFLSQRLTHFCLSQNKLLFEMKRQLCLDRLDCWSI